MGTVILAFAYMHGTKLLFANTDQGAVLINVIRRVVVEDGYRAT